MDIDQTAGNMPPSKKKPYDIRKCGYRLNCRERGTSRMLFVGSEMRIGLLIEITAAETGRPKLKGYTTIGFVCVCKLAEYPVSKSMKFHTKTNT